MLEFMGAVFYTLRSNDPIGIAYVAGLFDGEGWISGPKGTNGWRLGINMTDREPLDRCIEFFGGVLLGPYERFSKSGKPLKPIYNWALSGYLNVSEFCEATKHLLCPRRIRQIEKALSSKPKEPAIITFSCGVESVGGYHKHLRNKEPSCFKCQVAQQKYHWSWRHKGGNSYKPSQVFVNRYIHFFEQAGWL